MRNAIIAALVAAIISATGGYAAGYSKIDAYQNKRLAYEAAQSKIWQCRTVRYEDGSTKWRDAEAAYKCLKRYHVYNAPDN